VRRSKAAERRGIVSEKNQIRRCLAIRDELLLQDPPLSLQLTLSLVSALGSGAVRFLLCASLNCYAASRFYVNSQRAQSGK
jgi:hypothetical protein